MSRREYTIRFKCAEEGCTEWYHSVASTRRDETETRAWYAKRPWRCVRHTKPDEVLTPDNLERSAVLVAGRVRQSPTRRDPAPGYIDGLYWLEGDATSGGGFTFGPGFKAYAGDFPPGTRLIVTARIEVPEDDTEAIESETTE